MGPPHCGGRAYRARSTAPSGCAGTHTPEGAPWTGRNCLDLRTDCRVRSLTRIPTVLQILRPLRILLRGRRVSQSLVRHGELAEDACRMAGVVHPQAHVQGPLQVIPGAGPVLLRQEPRAPFLVHGGDAGPIESGLVA